MEEKIKGMIEGAAARFEDEIWSQAEGLRARCESPIEEALAVALLCHGTTSFSFMDVHFLLNPRRFEDGPPAPFDGVHIIPQATVGPYRVDFLLIEKNGDECRYVVIECDGHDYHERTKKQAARDKKRDREMAHKGITVLRFTGSEIWADADECAMDVFMHLVGEP